MAKENGGKQNGNGAGYSNREKSFQERLKDLIDEVENETAAANASSESSTDGANGNETSKKQMPYGFETAAEISPDTSQDAPFFAPFDFETQSKIQSDETKSKSTNGSGDNIHKGHRSRVRDAVDNDPELDSFAEHEILEYILFDTIPRQDTNRFAHELIDYFGSLWGVLNAKTNELTKFSFVSEKTARRIRSYIPIVRQAEISRLKNNEILDTTHRAASHLKSRMLYRNSEVVYVACLDVNDRLLAICRISQGDTNAVAMDFKRIAEAAFSSGASKIILAHNHPAETLAPSKDDISATKRLCISLLSMNILLVDHIIFTSDDYYSFYMNGLMNSVYENCDDVMGSQVCKQMRMRKIGLPDKYVLENNNHRYFVSDIAEEGMAYERISIANIFSDDDE